MNNYKFHYVIILLCITVVFRTIWWAYHAEYINIMSTTIQSNDDVTPPVAGENNIFFVETSCALLKVTSPLMYALKGQRIPLSVRAACAVEAAATAHPDRPVYVALTCPLPPDSVATAPASVRSALELPNVHLWPIRFAHEIKNSPLAPLLEPTKLPSSQWPVEHSSDVLRYLLLWKYGGTYLDTDMFILRPLNAKNFAVPEMDTYLGSAVLDFRFDNIGREVANKCIAGLLDFHPHEYTWHGPLLITRVLKERCKIEVMNWMERKDCNGFNLLPRNSFFPITYTEYEKFYKESQLSSVMNSISNSTGVHAFNFMGTGGNVSVSSKKPYAAIARRVCPHVVENAPGFL